MRPSALTLVALVVALAIHVLAREPAPFVLPAPTGAFTGTTSWTVTDEARADPFAPGTRRQVRVLAWYPAERVANAGWAPYLRDGIEDVRAFASLVRSPGAYDALATVSTHSQLDPPIASGPMDPATPSPASLPVLLFSHGYTASASAYTALLEDLASHGYVVLSVVHPYEASAVTLANGSVVTLLDGSGDMRQGIREVVSEWAKEDETMALVTRATSEGEQLRLLRGYLSTLPQTDVALRRWVDDTRLVLDRLSSLPADSPGGRLARRIDLRRIGAFGHSMGGVTAAQFCLEDRRCRAALNLDGIPQYGPMIDGRLDRPFLMVYSARPGREGASEVIYRRAASRYYRVDVRDTLHLEFSDMPLWGGPLRERGAFGRIAPERATEITRTVVREFFDQELLGKRSPILAGERVLPEVTARVVR